MQERIADHEAAATNLRVQASQKENEGSGAESRYLSSASDCHLQAAKQLEKAMTVPQDSPKVVAAWKDAAEQSEAAAKCYIQGVEMHSDGYFEGMNPAVNAGNAHKEASRCIVKSIEEDPSNATTWRKAASYHEIEAKHLIVANDEYRDQTVPALARRFFEDVNKELARCANEASQSLIKSIEDPTNKAVWKEAADVRGKAVGFFQQAVVAGKKYVLEKSPEKKTLLNEESGNYRALALNLQKAADCLKESIDDPTHATTWREAARHTQRKADYKLLAIEEREKKKEGIEDTHETKYQLLAQAEGELAQESIKGITNPRG